MSGKHTPGPWVIDPDSPLDIATYDFNMAIGCAFQHGEVDCEESCANARLMAAAPEMLEALKSVNAYLAKVEGQIEGGQSCFDIPAMLVRDAIAKAEGDAEAKAAAEIAEARAREERAELAWQKAEQDAKTAATKAAADLAAERQRVDEEIERQRDENEERVRAESAATAKRIEDERAKMAADKAKREADVNHRREVNQAAAKALVDQLGIPTDLAFSIVGLIAQGSIPNVSITY